MNDLNKEEVDDLLHEDNITGNCFVSAYRNVFMNKNYTLVHGIVTGQNKIEGIKYIHAWCECENTVFDTEANISMPKKIYYELGKIEHTVSYTSEQAIDLAFNTETYGYWHPIFDELDHIQRKK